MKAVSTTLALVLASAIAAPSLWAASTQLSAGKYISSLTPSVDEKMADKIEKQLGKIEEINSIDVKPADSSVHFTVKDNAQVDLARITNAIKTAAPKTAVSEPVLESASTSGASGTSSQPPAASPAATPAANPPVTY